jgi:hypothetical protein
LPRCCAAGEREHWPDRRKAPQYRFVPLAWDDI